MTAPTKALSELNKVVVASLDGPRLKGYVYNLSPVRESFHLLPPENPLQQHGTEVEFKNVKAVFFVADFIGNRGHKPNPLLEESPKHGRKIEVTWADGEILVGRTEAYNPQKIGFFMFPVHSDTNNMRIFVVNRNAKGIRFL
jgi:hypothetical protein